MMAGILSKNDIRRLISEQPPLIEDYVNLEQQLQPNGIDLSLREVAALRTPGMIGAGDNRKNSELAVMDFDNQGYIHLPPGSCIITYNEIVNIPPDIMATGFPRSSLLRCGVTLHTAVWDAGYSGRSRSLVIVHNPQGFTLQKDARVMQLVFHRLSDKTEGYKGAYQRENI